MRFEGEFTEYLIFVLLGILVGIFIGFVYSFLRSRFFKAEADRKLKLLTADFEQEKDTSENILRELEVGILAYSGSRLVIGNPAAKSLLGLEELPENLSSFLRKYGQDNGIQATVALQTHDISGVIHVDERVIRIRMTQAFLSPRAKTGWIIILQDITEEENEEKRRKEFVANVSHELKTPLTTISAYSETLLDWGLDGKEKTDVRADVERIHEDAIRMDALVGNLLLLSSIDSRGIKPRMVQYDAVSVMRQVISRMQMQAKEKGVELDSSVLSIIPPVFGDPSALDRILTNLISNGIKYTNKSGKVHISAQLTTNYISMKIVDDGMGVSKENLGRLFERFFRVDATGSRKYGGTGLGLSIAKELTEIQGGTISVSSVLGKGTEFVVTIPKAEKTYTETITALKDDCPRSELLYESAQNYLVSALEEMGSAVLAPAELSSTRVEELLRYLLNDPESESERAPLRPLEVLAMRQEKNQKKNV